MVRTAKEWGWSPTAIIRNAENPRKHHPADYAIAHAVEVLSEEKCPKCGVPVWYAYSEDQAVAFKEDSHKCYACVHQEEQRDGRKDLPGETYTVRAVPAEGYEELPSRAAFFEREFKKAVARAKREAENAE